jgi:hypothetical protein
MASDYNIDWQIGELSGKIDQILENQKLIMSKFDSHDIRLRGLERAHSQILGVGAVIALIVSAMTQWLKTKVSL